MVRPLVLRNVTVIDVTDGKPKPDMTVVISGNRIAAVGRNPRIPRHAHDIDGSGKFLIPGLWDMHVGEQQIVRGIGRFESDSVEVGRPRQTPTPPNHTNDRKNLPWFRFSP